MNPLEGISKSIVVVTQGQLLVPRTLLVQGSSRVSETESISEPPESKE